MIEQSSAADAIRNKICDLRYHYERLYNREAEIHVYMHTEVYHGIMRMSGYVSAMTMELFDHKTIMGNPVFICNDLDRAAWRVYIV
jgi:hypothetical protein